MNHIFQRDIYCHQLINPPAHDRRCNIDLQLSKSDGLIEFQRKYLTSPESVYSIRLCNIQQLGFTSTEQHALEHEFRNLILACNLVIQRTCITDKKVEFPTYEIVREQNESEVKAKKIDNLTQVNIVQNIDTYEKIHTVVIITENIDEKLIIAVFRKLQKINRYNMPRSSTVYDMNLNSSLEHYEQAMSEFSKLFKFRNMFNALEKLVNIDGKDITGEDFDTEAMKLDPKNCTQVKKWRNFYTRIKHVQRNPNDIRTYEQGEKDLRDELECSRRAVQGILLSKLNSM